MKRKDFEKLKTKSQAELTADVATAKEKLWQLGRDIAGGKVKNVREVRQVRIDIARMLTLLNSKHEASNPKQIQNTKS
jgi:ribosomal protein L29